MTCNRPRWSNWPISTPHLTIKAILYLLSWRMFRSLTMSLQSLARELVSARKVVGRLYENRAQLNSVSMHLGESVGKPVDHHLCKPECLWIIQGRIASFIWWKWFTQICPFGNRKDFNVLNIDRQVLIWWVAATARAVGHLQKSTEVMTLVNKLMKAPQIAATMQELSKEMMKVCSRYSSLLAATETNIFIQYVIIRIPCLTSIYISTLTMTFTVTENQSHSMMYAKMVF